MRKIKLTQDELENLCGQFFDKGYYGGLYQIDKTEDKSIEIYKNCKDNILKKIINKINKNK